VCLAHAQFYEAPGVASTVPNPDFPMHVRILSNYRSRNRFGYHGYGRGDLLSSPIQGFDYTFDCDRGFLHNVHSDEFYQARWKKPDQKLEILVQQVGSNHVEKCTLAVAMKSEPYGHYRTPGAPTAAPVPPPAPPMQP
jgi:hypothetical protein